ncbi:MAG: hypothetical protein NTZ18_00610 [Candidatus Komeilibacteria bacterium]|nr:hypothetical protein [Candidatus Komeilibacteria bacterium]
MTKEKIKRRPLNSIQPGYRYLVIIFTILALSLIGAILYFALSQATVYLAPNWRTQTVGFAIQIIDKNNLKAADDLSEKLAGEIISSSLEDTKTYPAEQFAETADKASGQITIANNYSKAQPLIATTRFLSPDNKLYRLSETVTVPAGGKVTATIVADQAGDTFAIGPTKFTIPGLWEGLRDKIYGESTETFKLQTVAKTKLTQETVDKAKADLANILFDKIKEKLNAQLPAGQKLADGALLKEILKYSTTAKLNSGQKEFSITLGLGVKGVVFDEAKLKEIASKNLPEIYKTGEALIKIDPNSFNYQVSLIDENSENLLAQIKGEYDMQIANVQIKPAELKGLSKKDALKYLQSFGDIKEVSIVMPFWTSYLPALEDKINIQIK